MLNIVDHFRAAQLDLATLFGRHIGKKPAQPALEKVLGLMPGLLDIRRIVKESFERQADLAETDLFAEGGPFGQVVNEGDKAAHRRRRLDPDHFVG